MNEQTDPGNDGISVFGDDDGGAGVEDLDDLDPDVGRERETLTPDNDRNEDDGPDYDFSDPTGHTGPGTDTDQDTIGHR